MENFQCELFLAAASQRYPYCTKAISALRILGKPPISHDTDHPSAQVQTALEAMAALECNLTGEYFAKDSPYDAATGIKKSWTPFIYSWVKFFLEYVILQEEPHTLVGLDFRDTVLHVLPLFLMYPETLGNLVSESRRMRNISHVFSLLVTRAWLQVIETAHFSWCLWADLLTGVLFPEDKDLTKFIEALDEINSSGQKDVASICIRFLNREAQRTHKMDPLELKGVQACLLLLCGCFHLSSPLYYPLLTNGGVTSLVKLFSVFVAQPRALKRFEDDSPQFQTVVSVIDLLILHLETSLSGQKWVAEALDAGLIISLFKANRLFDFDESGRSNREHEERSCWKFGRLIKKVGLYFVYPSVLHRFLRSVNKVEQLGLEDSLDPSPKCFLQMWTAYKIRAQEIHGLCVTLKDARRIMCGNDECDTESDDDDLEDKKLRYVRCSACQTAIYCSLDCARKQWKVYHHQECSTFAEAWKEGRPFPSTLDLRFIQALLECYVHGNRDKILEDIATFEHPNRPKLSGCQFDHTSNGDFDPHKRPIVLIDFDDVEEPDPMSALRMKVVDVETAVLDDRLEEQHVQSLLNGIHNARENQMVIILFVPGSAGRRQQSWAIVDISNQPLADDSDEESWDSEDDSNGDDEEEFSDENV